MTTQKIKVSRTKLIERIRAVELDEIANYEDDLAAYPAAVKNYDKLVVAQVRDLADKVKNNPIYRGEIEFVAYQHRVILPFKGEFPSKPKEPVYPSQHSKMISQLELSTEDTLTIEVNGSYRQYL